MSIQAIAWALEQDVPDAGAKLVLIALANAFNGQRGRCFPTIRQLVKEASASERTVQRKIRFLADMGLVKVEEARADDGRQKANEYLLNMTGEGVSLTGGGCQPDTGEGVTVDGGEGVSCDTPLKEPEEIPEERTLGAAAPSEPVPDLFEAFWSAYPKREGDNPKKPARQRFQHLVKGGADPQAMIAAARELARRHPVPTRFCPQAKTWLNQERFADAEAKAAPAKSKLKAPETEAEWAYEMRLARLKHEWWIERLGPPPFAPGCRVPPHLLTSKDDDYWRVRKAS